MSNQLEELINRLPIRKFNIGDIVKEDPGVPADRTNSDLVVVGYYFDHYKYSGETMWYYMVADGFSGSTHTSPIGEADLEIQDTSEDKIRKCLNNVFP